MQKNLRFEQTRTRVGHSTHGVHVWVPMVLGMMVICCESTRTMGQDHTLHLLSRACASLPRPADLDLAGLNNTLRKNGHFFGYGVLGLFFARAWAFLLQRRSRHSWRSLRLRSSALGVGSAAVIASLDEFHQRFLPNRHACVSDVLLDTAGALLLITAACAITVLQRKRRFARLQEARCHRTWHARLVNFERAIAHPSIL